MLVHITSGGPTVLDHSTYKVADDGLLQLNSADDNTSIWLRHSNESTREIIIIAPAVIQVLI